MSPMPMKAKALPLHRHFDARMRDAELKMISHVHVGIRDFPQPEIFYAP